MPGGSDASKVFLALVGTAYLLFGAFSGVLAVAFHDSGDPDFSFHRGSALGISALLLGGLYCLWLVRRVRNGNKSLERESGALATFWFVDLLIATVLAFYFWDDAHFSQAQYRGILVGQNVLALLGILSWLVALGSARGMARLWRPSLALLVFLLLAAGLFLSEASSVWLGF